MKQSRDGRHPGQHSNTRTARTKNQKLNSSNDNGSSSMNSDTSSNNSNSPNRKNSYSGGQKLGKIAKSGSQRKKNSGMNKNVFSSSANATSGVSSGGGVNYSNMRKQEDSEQALLDILNSQYRDNMHVAQLAHMKIYELSVLVNQMPQHLLNLQEINVSKNFLDNIDALNSMTRLIKINAADNYITGVNLQLINLQDLNLRNNFLEKIPILNQIPKLKVIDLAANNISDPQIICKTSNYQNVEKIVLRTNKINFNNRLEVSSLIEKLKKFKDLKVLQLQGNPFEERAEYSDLIATQLPPSIEIYNNTKIADVRRALARSQFDKDQERLRGGGTIADRRVGDTSSQRHNQLGQQTEWQTQQSGGMVDPFDENQDGGAAGGIHHTRRNKKQKNQLPTLEVLLYNIEAANSHPNKALEFLKELYVDAERISQLQMQVDFEKSFTRSKDPNEINEYIETFMQHAQLLTDNHFELRSIILSILSKLTIIKSYDFGIRCFNTLKDLMVAGREIEEQVMEQLKKEVIRQLYQRSPKDIPVSLLVGLRDLVEKSQQSQLLNNLFEQCFPNWLKDLKRVIQSKKQSKGQVTGTEKEDHFDAILALLAASVKDNPAVVQTILQTGMDEEINDIFFKSQPTQSRYLYLLQSMIQIARYSQKAASGFIHKYVHRELLSEIKTTYYNYKKHQDLVPQDSDHSMTLIIQGYKVFSAQIELIGALMNAEESEQISILKEPLVTDLLFIVTHSSTDPILLSSICYLAEMILTREQIRLNPSRLENILQRMGYCVHLLPYLGLSKYDALIKLTQKYNKSQQMTRAADNEINLQYQDDPIIHTLFIRIIRLVTFFGQELAFYRRIERSAISSTQRQILRHVAITCDQLNEANREVALFNCLEVPNDDVRLAVVECLFNVPLNEIDADEIDQILRLLPSQNVGAGKAEFVLATIFDLFAKMVKDTDSQASVQFKTKFSFIAINEALTILERNMNRKVDDEQEEQEKYSLSFSIVNFLKFASEVEQTKVHLQQKQEIMKRLLFCEIQNNCSPRFLRFPIEVEFTEMGQDFESLRNAITGNDSVNPYNFVAFRILHQMANLLQFYKDNELFDPYDSGENITDQLFKHYEGRLQRKIEREIGYWADFDKESMQQKIEYSDQRTYDQYVAHHTQFTNKNGVMILRMFLTKKQTEDENWLRMNSDPAIEHTGSKEEHPVFGRGLRAQIKRMKKQIKREAEVRQAEMEQIRKGEPLQQDRTRVTGFGGVGGHFRQETTDQSGTDPTKRMQDCFQHEELGSGFVQNQSDLYLAKHKQSIMIERLNKREGFQEQMGIANPEMRALCVAAFLRCLHASIEYAPDIHYHLDAVANLQSVYMFKSITQLCATTGWFKANIGTKYLQVMRYIIRIDSLTRHEKKENVVKYEVLAIVVNRILSILQAKIKNENNNQRLEVDDKMLLSHLAIISCEMVHQCHLFKWAKASKHVIGNYNRDFGLCKFKNQNGTLGESLRFQDTLLEQLVDFQLLKLFPLEVVQTLIEIVFRDMQNSNQSIYAGSSTSSSSPQQYPQQMADQEVANGGIHGAHQQSQQMYQQQMSMENLWLIQESEGRAREHIKKFLASYLAHCTTHKFDVLLYLMRNMVFNGKQMRICFLQEILQATFQNSISEAYAKYICFKKLTLDEITDQSEETRGVDHFQSTPGSAAAYGGLMQNSKSTPTPGQQSQSQSTITPSEYNRRAKNQRKQGLNSPDNLVLANGSSVGYLSLPFNMLLKVEREMGQAQKLFGPERQEYVSALYQEMDHWSHYLKQGERINFCQPINVLIKDKSSPTSTSSSHSNSRSQSSNRQTQAQAQQYECYQVMITNVGVYIIHDEHIFEKPCHGSQCQPEHLCKGGPLIVRRFTFDQITKVTNFGPIIQKIKLDVTQPAFLLKNLDYYSGSSSQDKEQNNDEGATESNRNEQFSDSSSDGENDTLQQKNSKYNNQTKNHVLVRGQRAKHKESQLVSFEITLVVPSLLDSKFLKRVFDEVCSLNSPEIVNEELNEDFLLQQAILNKLLSSEVSNEEMDITIAYAYELNSSVKLIDFADSKLNMGVTRLLQSESGSKENRNREDKKSSKGLFGDLFNFGSKDEKKRSQLGHFGILVITEKSIYFLEENPGCWIETKQSAVRECIEMLSLGQTKQNSKRNGQGSSRGNKHSARQNNVGVDNMVLEENMQEIQSALHNIVRLKWYHQIADLKSINVVDCKIPAMELIFKDDENDTHNINLNQMNQQTPNPQSGNFNKNGVGMTSSQTPQNDDRLGGADNYEQPGFSKNGNPLLSLIADYNSQLILHKLLEMKRGADRLRKQRQEQQRHDGVDQDADFLSDSETANRI